VLYQRAGDQTASITVLGIGLNFDAVSQSSEAGVFGGAGFDYQFSQAVSAFGNVEALRTDDTQSFSGSAGVRYKF
jgi:hypothetical protein